MKWKLALNIATFVALGLIIFFARNDITRVFEHMRDLNVIVLLFMAPAQLLVYFCYAKIFYYFFNATGTNITLKQLIAPMIELNFVNHIFPSGGVSGFSYLTLRLKPYGVSTARSTLSQLARFAFMFMGFICLMLVALILLAAEGHTSSLVVLAVSAVTFSMLFVTTILIFVIGSEHRIAVFTNVLAKSLNRLIHLVRRKHPETISLERVQKTFIELHEDYLIIRRSPKAMGRVGVWALGSSLAELTLLYLAFVAHGAWVNPGAVVIGFVIASTAGLFAILPGGLGVYEPLMTAVLISAGVEATLALSATLVYRVISLLLSLITGYILYQRAIQRYGTTNLSS
jgi:uncharacterized protein (TIRG00374 family)